MPADEPVGNVDVGLVVLRLPVFDQEVAYRVGESLQLGEQFRWEYVIAGLLATAGIYVINKGK